MASLKWSDIAEGKDGTLLVQVRESKTNQEGELGLRLLKNGAANGVRQLKQARQLSEDALVIGHSTKLINPTFKDACRNAGIYGRLTAHSGRIGQASELVTRGASSSAVALAGGWKPERMVLHYSKRARVEHGAIAKYLLSLSESTKRLNRSPVPPSESTSHGSPPDRGRAVPSTPSRETEDAAQRRTGRVAWCVPRTRTACARSFGRSPFLFR